jgi:hypothetical protein
VDEVIICKKSCLVETKKLCGVCGVGQELQPAYTRSGVLLIWRKEGLHEILLCHGCDKIGIFFQVTCILYQRWKCHYKRKVNLFEDRLFGVVMVLDNIAPNCILYTSELGFLILPCRVGGFNARLTGSTLCSGRFWWSKQTCSIFQLCCSQDLVIGWCDSRLYVFQCSVDIFLFYICVTFFCALQLCGFMWSKGVDSCFELWEMEK